MRRILIADDYYDNAEVLEILLTWEGFDTKIVSSRGELLMELDSYRPDLAIIDIHLGDSDGRDIAKELKNEQRYSELKIILMTAGTASGQAELPSEYCNGFFKKPFDLEKILYTIRGLLGEDSDNKQ